MKMLLLSFIFLFSLQAFAKPTVGGGVDGGGGRSVVCRDTKGQIVSAELLDLYEGRVQYGYEPQYSSEGYVDQAKKAGALIAKGRDKSFRENLKSLIELVDARKVILPDGTGLEEINDSHHVIIPRGCKVEQLANFTNQSKILIDGQIWDKLDLTNKAALVLHEALYKIFRMYGAKNSIRARLFVAAGFAGLETFGIKTDVPKKAYECHTLPNSDGAPFPGSKFWAYNDADGELVFQFDYLDGGLMLSTSKVSLDKIPVSRLNRVNDSTYWINLESDFEENGVAVSFETKLVNGVKVVEKKINLGEMPASPKQKFECYPAK